MTSLDRTARLTEIMAGILNSAELDALHIEKCVGTICELVNGVSHVEEETADALYDALTPCGRQAFYGLACSCILALGNAGECKIDGRNGFSAKACRMIIGMTPDIPDLWPEAGKRFLRQHRTLQQSAIGLMCCYAQRHGNDSRIGDADVLHGACRMMEREIGLKWYCFPLV